MPTLIRNGADALRSRRSSQELGYQDSNLEWLNQNQLCCQLNHTPLAAYNRRSQAIFGPFNRCDAAAACCVGPTCRLPKIYACPLTPPPRQRRQPRGPPPPAPPPRQRGQPRGPPPTAAAADCGRGRAAPATRTTVD